MELTKGEGNKKVLSSLSWIQGWKEGKEEDYAVLKDLVEYGRERPRLGWRMEGDGASSKKRLKDLVEFLEKSGRFFLKELTPSKRDFSSEEIQKLGKRENLQHLLSLESRREEAQGMIRGRLYDCDRGKIREIYNSRISRDHPREDLVELAQKIVEDFPLQGLVIDRQRENFFIDLGRIHGLRKGDTLEVFQRGEVIRHPLTREPLRVEVELLTRARVIQAFSNTSLCQPEKKMEIPLSSLVRIKKAGYEESQQVITLPAGKKSVVSFQLVPFYKTEFGIWMICALFSGLVVLVAGSLRLLDWWLKSWQSHYRISPSLKKELTEKLPYPLALAFLAYTKGELPLPRLATLTDQFLTALMWASHPQDRPSSESYEVPWESFREELIGTPSLGDWLGKVQNLYNRKNSRWWVLETEGIQKKEWLLIGGWKLLRSLRNPKTPTFKELLLHSGDFSEELQRARIEGALIELASVTSSWEFFVPLEEKRILLAGGQEKSDSQKPSADLSWGHLYLKEGEKLLDLYPYLIFLFPLAFSPLSKFFFLDKILPLNQYHNHYFSWDRGVLEERILKAEKWEEALESWISDPGKKREIRRELEYLFHRLAEYWN